MNNRGRLSLTLAILLFSIIIITPNAIGERGFSGLWCKDIVACGDATAGDYNYLLKVRDPSRPGLQVLCIVPEGYEYTYRYPWTGKPLESKVLHKFIGVATIDDIIPNIVKAGMTLSDAGIAYGDADTGSRWINPTKNAWDDFDWIRYACEKANNEDEAASLLTEDVVKKMHATAVTENLFVVGPNKGYVIEADAYRYDIKEINNGVVAMSNYPKKLWKTQRLNTFLISRSFDTVKEKYVRNKGTVRLGSLYGVKIVEIGDDFISVRPASLIQILKTKSFGTITRINLSERRTVGYFSVELLDIDGNKAKVRACNKFKAWEEKIFEYIQPKYGEITLNDMINWSRLHKDEMDGLRPMCENFFEFEAVAIYKIPKENYELLSEGWFSPNHACSSIYVPFHICDTEIYDPYENGDAAQLSLDLLDTYGHDYLSDNFSKTEQIFLKEIDHLKDLSNNLKDTELSTLFTTVDTSMQRQAFLTQELWLESSKNSKQNEINQILSAIWDSDYSSSLAEMKNAFSDFMSLSIPSIFKDKILDIALDICKTKIISTKILGYDTSYAEDEYNQATELLDQGDYEDGFNKVQKTYTNCEQILSGATPIKPKDIEESETVSIDLLFLVFLLVIAVIILLIAIRKK
jgi:hypothetical protein